MSEQDDREQRAATLRAKLSQDVDQDAVRAEIEAICADALVDLQDPAVQRVIVFVQAITGADNPFPILRQSGDTWLKSSRLLRSRAQAILKAKAEREAAEAESQTEE